MQTIPAQLAASMPTITPQPSLQRSLRVTIRNINTTMTNDTSFADYTNTKRAKKLGSHHRNIDVTINCTCVALPASNIPIPSLQRSLEATIGNTDVELPA